MINNAGNNSFIRCEEWLETLLNKQVGMCGCELWCMILLSPDNNNDAERHMIKRNLWIFCRASLSPPVIEWPSQRLLLKSRATQVRVFFFFFFCWVGAWDWAWSVWHLKLYSAKINSTGEMMAFVPLPVYIEPWKIDLFYSYIQDTTLVSNANQMCSQLEAFLCRQKRRLLHLWWKSSI